MIRILSAIAVSVALSLPLCLPGLARAQDHSQGRIFADFETLYEFLDTHLYSRDFLPVLTRLGAGQVSPADRHRRGQKLQALYPQDFTDRASFRTRGSHSGFNEEIIAYWTGQSYLWLYLVTHTQDAGLVVIELQIDSDFSTIAARF